jgi:hypothetical protein
MANQMLSVGGTIWDWGIPIALVKHNPFEKIKTAATCRGRLGWLNTFVCTRRPIWCE